MELLQLLGLLLLSLSLLLLLLLAMRRGRRGRLAVREDGESRYDTTAAKQKKKNSDR
jgi:hypothetical protein